MAKEAAQSMNDFAFALAKETMLGGTKNEMVSPLSMSMCLTMLLNGTTGASAAELSKALRLDSLGLDNANDAYTDILRRTKIQNGVEINIANAIWTFKTATPKPDFISKMKTTFDAEITGMGTPDGAAVNRINEWVSKNTKERIPKLLDQLDPMTVMVLTNAIAFDGKWVKPFDPSLTHRREFHAATGSLNVDMMGQGGKEIRYAETDGMQAVWLPYRGDGFSMAFVLPKKGETVSTLLDSGVWKKLDSVATPSEGSMWIPKFKFSAGYDMVGPLSNLGARKIFEFSRDFDPMVSCDQPVRVSQVVHKTFVQVDEKGTKAAAATAIVPKAASAMPERKKTFVFEANRPFLFAIVDSRTGGIAFLGVVNNPLQ
jgi:serpin B